MCVELVLKRRTEILDALCIGGSTESLDRVLDILLARGELLWEEYQEVRVPGRTLYANARRLLDVVHSKGARTCEIFLDALSKVQPDGRWAGAQLSAGSSGNEEPGGASAQVLLARRPSLVRRLQGRVEGALEVLVEAGVFTVRDVDDVRVPVHTPAQQARRLLDLVRSKGESAADVILRYIQQDPEPPSAPNGNKGTLSKEFIKYQTKLRSSILAQSCFLSSYGGTGLMALDDIYTEGQLELPQDCIGVHGAPLTLEDVAGAAGAANENADTVLVSGAAGSGKSTLLQRLHLLWAREEALTEFLLLFPFSCRRLNSEEREVSVRELLFRHCCWPDREQDQIFQFILDHPDLIIFTFDGLDELKQGFSDEHRLCCPTEGAPVHTLLFNLLQGSLLKGVRKVITSRPEAAGHLLRKHLRKEVLLKGFSQSGIEGFVKKQHADPAVAARVLGSLQSNKALLGLCHSPVLCWIVSRCHKELLGCGDGTPATSTDVYLMILQHFLQHQSPPKTRVSTGWLREHLETVLHLGRLAFQGIGTSCYVFSVADLQRCNITEEEMSVGFLIESKDISRSQEKRYEFLHVMIQCFFAALYIVLSKKTDRSTVPKLFELKDMTETNSVGSRACLLCVNQHSQAPEWEPVTPETPNLQIAATFVSGLLSRRHRSLWLRCCPGAVIRKKTRQAARHLSKGMQKHFKSIPPPVKGEKKSMHAMPSFVWLIKCIYEMQESGIARDAVMKLDVDHLKLTYCNIGPVECTALAYVLLHLRNPVGLQLDNNSVGDVGVEQLLPCMHVCDSLHLRNNDITDEGIRKLISRVVQCDGFRKIALFNNKLTDACTKDFARLLKTKQNFCALRLGNNNITSEGAKQLAEGLRCNRSLEYLGLWGNKIGDAGAEVLAGALEGSKTLTWFSLVENGIGDPGAGALAKMIQNCTSLEHLWLTENCITRQGVEYLIQALEHNTHMKSVWLRNNALTSGEVEEMKQREARLIF